jgi:hypothetical protein
MARRPKASPKRKSRKDTDKEQSERFMATARALGSDESGAKFEASFAKIVPAKRRPTERGD